MACALRHLKPNELNYPTHDLELAAFVYTLKISRHDMYGATFNIFTDRKSLKHLLTQKYEPEVNKMARVPERLLFHDL